MCLHDDIKQIMLKFHTTEICACSSSYRVGGSRSLSLKVIYNNANSTTTFPSDGNYFMEIILWEGAEQARKVVDEVNE